MEAMPLREVETPPAGAHPKTSKPGQSPKPNATTTPLFSSAHVKDTNFFAPSVRRKLVPSPEKSSESPDVSSSSSSSESPDVSPVKLPTASPEKVTTEAARPRRERTKPRRIPPVPDFEVTVASILQKLPENLMQAVHVAQLQPEGKKPEYWRLAGPGAGVRQKEGKGVKVTRKVVRYLVAAYLDGTKNSSGQHPIRFATCKEALPKICKTAKYDTQEVLRVLG